MVPAGGLGGGHPLLPAVVGVPGVLASLDVLPASAFRNAIRVAPNDD